jgi:two-component system cell cycle response regulator
MPETNLQAALVVGERLRLSIDEAPFVLPDTGKEIKVTVSIGVATTLDHGDSPTDLLRRADEALYAAKNGGRNRMESWPLQSNPVPVRMSGMAMM